MNIDSTDLQILAALQPNGRLSNVELASRVHLSASACLRRVKALEEGGVIQGYRASVDPISVGLPDNVFVSVGLASQDQADLDAFEEAVRRAAHSTACWSSCAPVGGRRLRGCARMRVRTRFSWICCVVATIPKWSCAG